MTDQATHLCGACGHATHLHRKIPCRHCDCGTNVFGYGTGSNFDENKRSLRPQPIHGRSRASNVHEDILLVHGRNYGQECQNAWPDPQPRPAGFRHVV